MLSTISWNTFGWFERKCTSYFCFDLAHDSPHSSKKNKTNWNIRSLLAKNISIILTVFFGGETASSKWIIAVAILLVVMTQMQRISVIITVFWKQKSFRMFCDIQLEFWQKKDKKEKFIPSTMMRVIWQNSLCVYPRVQGKKTLCYSASTKPW